MNSHDLDALQILLRANAVRYPGAEIDFKVRSTNGRHTLLHPGFDGGQYSPDWKAIESLERQGFVKLMYIGDHLKEIVLTEDGLRVDISSPTAGTISISPKKTERDEDTESSEDAVILHISDLHWGANSQDAQTPQAYESSLKTILRDILESYKQEKIPKPNIIVASGDMTNKGTISGYPQSRDFLLSLCECLGIVDIDNRLVIVPGNHDVHRPLSRLASNEIPGLHDSSTQSIIPSEYRFIPFKLFFEETYPRRRFSLDPDSMFQVHDLTNDHNLVIVGFNSAMGTDHTDSGAIRGYIPAETVEAALNKLKDVDNYQAATKIAVWHHARLWKSTPEDPHEENGVLGLLVKAGFSVVLHGHIHRSSTTWLTPGQEMGQRILKCGVGSLTVPTTMRPVEQPRQYQVLSFTYNRPSIKIHARNLVSSNWQADAMYNGKSFKTYRLKS